MENLLLIPIYIIDSIKYIKGNRLIYSTERHVEKIWCTGLILSILYTVLSFFLPQNPIIHILVVYLLSIMVGFFSIRQKDTLTRLSHLACLIVILIAIDQSVFLYIDIFKSYFGETDFVLYLSSMLQSLWGLFVILFLDKTFGQKRKPNKNFLSQKKINYIILTVSGILLTAIVILNISYQYFTDGFFQFLTGFFISVSYVAVCLLLWMLLYFRSKKEKAETYADAQEQLRQSQVSYYEQLLKKEEATRAFRHDIRSQLNVMLHLASQQQYEELHQHLLDVDKEYYTITHRDFYTGNDIFDILLKDKLSYLRKDIKVNIFGCFKKNCPMNSVDLCIIFSNLLENAVEALNDYEGKNGYLDVSIEKNASQTLVTIKNSIDKEISLDRKGLPITSKSDFTYHGYGITNVQKTVKKYNGFFDFTIKPDCFEAYVIF